jgi:hypothetical protein
MFNIDLFRKRTNRKANKRTVAENGQQTILDSDIISWSDVLPKLRKVPEGVKKDDYSQTTVLGSQDGFMKAFETATLKYHEMYDHSGKWGTVVKGSQTLSSLTMSPFRSDDKDPSFAQKIDVPSDSKVIFIGDIHSSFHSFIEIIEHLVSRSILGDDLVLNPKYFIIFIGDIFDRGPYALDILNIIIRIKNKNFEKVIIGNGNHEDIGMYIKGGTGEEVSKQLISRKDKSTFHTLVKFFPSVIFIKMDGKILQCCHGGIEPYYSPKSFIESEFEFDFHGYDTSSLVNSGLRWTDFDTSVDTIAKSARGGDTLVYGIKNTNEYLKYNNIDGIIRGHQDLVHFSMMPRSSKPKDLTMGLIGINDDEMFGPTDIYPNVKVGVFDRFPLHNFFSQYTVATTSTATWSKDTGYYSYLELKTDIENAREAQELIIPEVERAFSSLNARKELKFLKEFKLGDKMDSIKYDKMEETRVLLRKNFKEFSVLFPVYELLSYKPFERKVKTSIFSRFKMKVLKK